MANLGYVSTFNINGNELSLKDAALTEIVNEIIEAIGANNGDISDRINNLHERSFDALIKISSQNESEIASIQDGMYKLQYVTVTGEGDNAVETLNNSAILIQKETNQYLYKDGQISSRTKTDSTWSNWITFEGGVTSVNGQTGVVITSLSSNYVAATGVNSALELTAGDTYETAFGKLEKAITDNENVTSTAIDDLDDRLTELTNGVGDKNIIESISLNGITQTITNKNVNIAETKLSKGTTTGAGNAVTDITVSNHQITLVKGATYATQSDINTSIANLVDSAPETLNTLNELAAALGDDPNFATTVATQIGQKYTKPSLGIPASDLAEDAIPVTSVNGMIGAVVIPEGGVTSFNGATGAITYSAPVTSVNGQTGVVTITETQLSKGTATGSGNAVTDITVSNHQITLVKGATYATQSDIDTSIAALVDSAPGTLDTLNELAAALGDDPNFVTSIATQIGQKYTKPSTGIPSTDLADDVQTNLTLAGTALQSFTETDPTVPSHVKNITSQDITNWNNKLSTAPVTSVNGQTGTVSLALGDTNVIETIKVNNTSLTPVSKAVNITVPTKVSDLTNDSNFTSNVGTITGITMNGVSKGTNGVVDLGTVLTEHQDISGKVDKVTGMGLSSNDYTTTEKNKLAGINIGSLDSLTTTELNSIFS